MKKIVCSIAKCIIICLLLGGCQPNPQRDAIIGRETQKYTESQPTAASGDGFSIDAPTEYVATLESGNPNVSIEIDAAVVATHLDAYKVYSAAPVFLSQDMVDQAISVLLGNNTLYNTISTTDLTQAEVLERLAHFKQLQAELEANKDSSAYVEEMIAFYSVKLKTAPVTIERTVNDGRFGEKSATPTQDPNSPPVPMLLPPGNDYNSINAIVNMGKDTYASFSAYRSDSGKASYIRFTNCGSSYLTNSYQNNSSDLASLELTFSDAKYQAEDVIQKLGLTHMQLTLSLSDKVIVPQSSQQEHPCYVFVFSRNLGGLPVTYRKMMHSTLTSGEMYSETWAEEYAVVSIDDTGILSFLWQSPTSIPSTLNENTSVLPFAEAMEYADRHFKNNYSWLDESISEASIVITEIRLGMTRIAIGTDEYLYVPTWDFIGTGQERSNEDDGLQNYNDAAQSYLIINAVDGSIIDSVRGY